MVIDWNNIIKIFTGPKAIHKLNVTQSKLQCYFSPT